MVERIGKKSRMVVIGSASALAVAAAGTASAFEMQAGGTAVELYGYAKLDIIYDLDADLGRAVSRDNIGLDDAEVAEGFSRIQAVESRLGLRTTTPTAMGDLVTVIEGDFFTPTNTFRLRQAYGEWNNILAGQTWSNFSTFVGFTPTLDFNGQPGQTVINRQAQLRFTWAGIAVALESATDLGGALVRPDILEGDFEGFDNVQQGELPDLTLRYELNEGAFSVAASGVLRRVGFDDGINSDHSVGYGLGLAGALELIPGIRVQGAVVYGDGIGGYMYLAPGPAGFVDNDNNVETVEQIGGTFGVSADIGQGTVNVAYGIAYADWDDAEDAFALSPGIAEAVAGSNERFQGLFLNYIWSPSANVSYGIEAGYHRRKVVNGDDGDAVRLHGAVTYSF